MELDKDLGYVALQKDNIMLEYNGNNSEKIVKIISILTTCMIVIGLGFILLASISGNNTGVMYKVVVLAWIVLYLLINDLAEPYFSKLFNTMTPAQKKSYFAYFFLNFVSFIMLGLFVVNAHLYVEPFHYVALVVFVVLIIPKNILLKQAVSSKKTDAYSQIGKSAEYVEGMYKFDEYVDIAGKKKKSKLKKEKNYISNQNYNRKSSYKSTSKKKNPGQEAFEEPRLVRDRFITMELEGYVGGKSVDDTGNVK